VTDITTFSLQLSNFSYVSVKHHAVPTKKLRFTLVATFDHPIHGQLALGCDGCLASLNSENILVWSPPLSRINAYKAIKTNFINETLYDLVLGYLARTEYVSGLSRDAWTEEDRNPRIANPDLPEVVNVV
jgi:hypothetical protein